MGLFLTNAFQTSGKGTKVSSVHEQFQTRNFGRLLMQEPTNEHEFVFEEHDSLQALESSYQEFCTRREAFWAQREQFPLGYPAHILAALLQDLADFDQRFQKFASAARQLEVAHHSALVQRLLEIQGDCKRTTSLIQDMHEDRLASEREAMGIAVKPNHSVLDGLGSIGRGLRHALFSRNKAGE